MNAYRIMNSLEIYLLFIRGGMNLLTVAVSFICVSEILINSVCFIKFI